MEISDKPSKVQTLESGNQLLTELTYSIGNQAISGVRFARVYDAGFYSTLCTHDGIPDYLAANKIHIAGYAPKDLIKDKFWYFVTGEGRYSQVLKDYQEMCKVTCILNHVERHSEYFDIFGIFLTGKNEILAASNAVNHMNFFEHFILQFKLLGSDILTTLNRKRNPLPIEMQTNFKGLEQVENANSSRVPELIKKLILEINVSLKANSGASFTQREMDCIQLLLMNQTYKEIAEALQLAPRTVEFYIENIKLKIGCSKKSEIVRYFYKRSSHLCRA